MGILENGLAETTSGERIGVNRSEDAERNNAEIAVLHDPNDATSRTLIRLSPQNARLIAGQLNEVADALDAEHPGAERR
ncbi:hypothetical protein [Nocardia salmonicida]|uniref:hypothetical protein n=1 Tax=Nocardia salmonicida TaxID=53431 RepID=UPI00378B3B92